MHCLDRCGTCGQIYHCDIQKKWNYFDFKGIYLSKALTVWKFSRINKNSFFVKETDTFGHIVVWTTFTSHINHFKLQHTAFEQSATCLSVFLKSLPGLIPLTMLWHAGWTLENTFTWTLPTIIRLQYLVVFWPKNYVFLVLFTIF